MKIMQFIFRSVLLLFFSWILWDTKEITEKLFPDSVWDDVQQRISFTLSFITPIVTYLILDQGIEKLSLLPISRISEEYIFPVDDFIKKLERSEKIIILDIYIDTLLNRKNYGQFSSALRIAIDNGAEIKVLIVDPNSPIAHNRAEEIKNRHDNNKDDAIIHIANQFERIKTLKREIILSTKKNSAEVESKFLLRKIQQKIEGAIYQCDNEIYWAFYQKGDISSNHPHLLVSISSNLGKYLKKQFNELWESGVPITD